MSCERLQIAHLSRLFAFKAPTTAKHEKSEESHSTTLFEKKGWGHVTSYVQVFLKSIAGVSLCLITSSRFVYFGQTITLKTTNCANRVVTFLLEYAVALSYPFPQARKTRVSHEHALKRRHIRVRNTKTCNSFDEDE